MSLPPIRLQGPVVVAGYFAATLLAGGLLAGPVHFLLAPCVDTGIVRVTGRCLLLAAFLLAPLALRGSATGLATALGGGRSARVFAGGLALGLALGAASFAPHVALLLAAGARVPAAGPGEILAALPAVLPPAVLTGMLVAVVEESLFRGVVFSAARRSGAAGAIGLSALIYAVAHFLRPESPAAVALPVHWYSGFSVIGLAAARFADPARLAGDFLALLTAGIALALIRERTGHVAVGIGLHAAWVAGIKLTRDWTDREPQSPWSWLVGEFDGVIGYLAALWILLVTLASAMGGRRRRAN